MNHLPVLTWSLQYKHSKPRPNLQVGHLFVVFVLLQAGVVVAAKQISSSTEKRLARCDQYYQIGGKPRRRLRRTFWYGRCWSIRGWCCYQFVRRMGIVVGIVKFTMEENDGCIIWNAHHCCVPSPNTWVYKSLRLHPRSMSGPLRKIERIGPLLAQLIPMTSQIGRHIQMSSSCGEQGLYSQPAPQPQQSGSLRGAE